MTKEITTNEAVLHLQSLVDLTGDGWDMNRIVEWLKNR